MLCLGEASIINNPQARRKGDRKKGRREEGREGGGKILRGKTMGCSIVLCGEDRWSRSGSVGRSLVITWVKMGFNMSCYRYVVYCM